MKAAIVIALLLASCSDPPCEEQYATCVNRIARECASQAASNVALGLDEYEVSRRHAECIDWSQRGCTTEFYRCGQGL